MFFRSRQGGGILKPRKRKHKKTLQFVLVLRDAGVDTQIARVAWGSGVRHPQLDVYTVL